MMKRKDDIVEVSNEIKDVVGYVWNDQIYKTKLDAQKARALYKIHKLFPEPDRDPYSQAFWKRFPSDSMLLDKHKDMLIILGEITE